MSKQIIFGGGKRKRTRHIFVGKRVASLPPPSQQSDFYKKTKAKIENATADFLKDEKNRILTYRNFQIYHRQIDQMSFVGDLT